MKKIPTIFDRDWNGDRSRVLDIPHPDCGWVFAGEGIPTRKIDGTSCLVRSGKLFKRRELKAKQPEPEGFVSEGSDAETGKTVGWVPVDDYGPEDKYHREAWEKQRGLGDGTYELIGPNVQKNPENVVCTMLVAHGDGIAGAVPGVPRDFAGLAAWFEGKDIEGLVFHHPDGRMAKIKMRDFGLKRGAK
jgi:Family of unknown function (DUF5565)